MTYRLNVHKIDQSCLFELAWGKGQRLTASLAFPAQLMGLYDTWRRAYLGYYKQALRGRVGAIGQVTSLDVNWHSNLVLAEARLLSEFHKWLKHGDLFDLRAELTKASEKVAAGSSKSPGAAKAELFLTCTPLEMARLPWETWEFGQHMQIVRSPANIRSETVDRQPFRRGKTRVLAILGDETGLNFEEERNALNAQKKLLDIHYTGWQPGENTASLRERICREIADPLGWDVLFFAGHSNEAALLDGQVAIAPKTTISIKELSPYLKQAQQRGLQFALFNSCSGLDIANALIDLGLSQVAIMREPIHNEVAQAFLVQLLQRLARYENVQEALLGACQFLKLEQNLTYPSAYLVPSLFRHPESVPYRVQPAGLRKALQHFRPSPWEAAAIGVIAVLSLLPPVQDWLLSQRVWAQAVYRDVTTQLAPAATPIVLVRIDDRTLQERRILRPSPIDRTLLTDIVTQLAALEAKVVGIDYLLDRPTDNDAELRQALEQGVEQNQQWFVFATKRNDPGDWLTVYPDVASTNWVLTGDIRVPWWHVHLRGWSERPLPFSYQLAIAHYLTQPEHQTSDIPRPNLQSQKSLQALVEGYWEATHGGQPPLSERANLSIFTNLSRWIYQRWLHPILDFSLPPEQVYKTIPAWQLLQEPNRGLQEAGLSTLQGQVVIVIAGGYDEVGEDTWPLPSAVAYWRDQAVGVLSGGEAHAYMAHHFLTGHMVMPIPDLWMVLAAALGSKALLLGLGHQFKRYPVRSRWIFAGATAGYGLLCLQLYVSGLVLVPWFLPSATASLYLLPLLRNNSHEST
ncbi:CHASE2 domain-containing protein [Pseudanabaena sp. FACHB-2040]|uniref:CHASE2 domain-containing protein n=1 Tax=Pseudanabaena sp. FACHB-2040 TaxID=2692859 RepID=UPI001689B753|nr:CHASE2 domain-containing protein [Pseudanabaena sp. FACHB-2040]MBD2259320.1 CHASE2 domain-containing protein [Pseudanabaena sp. FACHB-2040]